MTELLFPRIRNYLNTQTALVINDYLTEYQSYRLNERKISQLHQLENGQSD